MKDIISLLLKELNEESVEQHMEIQKTAIEDRVTSYEKQLPKFIEKVHKFVTDMTYEEDKEQNVASPKLLKSINL
jgi:transcriptional regulator CtsR